MQTKSPVSETLIRRLLRTVRTELGMDVAFVSQLTDSVRIFRYVDAADGEALVVPDGFGPRQESYCHYVVDGSLPGLIEDAAAHPLASTLAATATVPVGTHLSVPIRFSDGRVYGTFCTFSRQVDDTIDAADLRAVEVLANVAGQYLEELDRAEAAQARAAEAVRSVLATPDALTIAFQPIADLETGDCVSVEALARFPQHRQSPLWFFEAAGQVGLGTQLELRAVAAALELRPLLAAGIGVNLNVSPATLVSPAFRDLICSSGTEGITLEITEHAAADDHARLTSIAAELRRSGLRISIDDVGMGFSGLSRILELSPDQLKLDRVVVTGVDADPARRALIEALVSFAAHSGASIVAEGIETAEELRVLRELGVELGQGYHLARPMPLHDLPTSVRVAEAP